MLSRNLMEILEYFPLPPIHVNNNNNRIGDSGAQQTCIDLRMSYQMEMRIERKIRTSIVGKKETKTTTPTIATTTMGSRSHSRSPETDSYLTDVWITLTLSLCSFSQGQVSVSLIFIILGPLPFPSLLPPYRHLSLIHIHAQTDMHHLVSILNS